MNGGEMGSWWKIGFVMVICINIIREFVVLVFGIPQESMVLYNGRPWFDFRQIHAVWQVLLSVAGVIIVIMVICILYGGKREKIDTSVRNALFGSIVGFIVALILGMTADLMQWALTVAILTGGAGFLMGMEKIMAGGLYWGFGMLFGAALMISMFYGFAVGGLLLFLAIGIGIVFTGIGGLLGLVAGFCIKQLSTQK